MEDHLSGTWQEFEEWIRNTIAGDFRWKIRPQDNASNREMVASVELALMKAEGRATRSIIGVLRTGDCVCQPRCAALVASVSRTPARGTAASPARITSGR